MLSAVRKARGREKIPVLTSGYSATNMSIRVPFFWQRYSVIIAYLRRYRLVMAWHQCMNFFTLYERFETLLGSRFHRKTWRLIPTSKKMINILMWSSNTENAAYIPCYLHTLVKAPLAAAIKLIWSTDAMEIKIQWTLVTFQSHTDI